MEKSLHLLLVLFLIFPAVSVRADGLALPAPGVRVDFSSAYQPPVMVGIKVDPKKPFHVDFIIDQGNAPEDAAILKDEITRSAKYFLASLTIPTKDLWVNLSPDEHDRIVPDLFGQTEMGRDLLAQDYLLKQIASSAIYPDEAIGKKFWDEVYREAAMRFGTTDVPMDARNRVWIVPVEATVYEREEGGNTAAMVVRTHLKVLTEVEYLTLVKNHEQGGADRPLVADQHLDLAASVMREIVLPALEHEVNEGSHFSRLRQIYHAFILASWYKKKIKGAFVDAVYVDKKKVAGVETGEPNAVEDIYQQYVASFKQGAFDLIKEEKDVFSGELIPRKYFSGGVVLDDAAMGIVKAPSFLQALVGRKLTGAGCTLVPNEEALKRYPSEVRSRVFLDPAVSYEDIRGAHQGPKRVLYEGGRSLVRDGGDWPIFKTTIQEINTLFMSVLGGSVIDRIARQAALTPDKLFYVLDWGAGDLSAAKGLLVEMRRRGINNVHVIATTDTIRASLLDVLSEEKGISLVVAPFQTTGRLLEQALPQGALIQGGYSKSGFHFLFNEDSRQADVVEHLSALSRSMSPEGFFVFDLHFPKRIDIFHTLFQGSHGIDRKGIWASLKEEVAGMTKPGSVRVAVPASIHVVAGQTDFAAVPSEFIDKGRFREERFLNGFGGGTETSRVIFEQYSHMLQEIVGQMQQEGQKVEQALVLGFGNSYWELEEIGRVTQAPIVNGIELHLDRFKKAEEYYRGKEDRYRLYQQSFEGVQLPFDDGSLDVIFGQNLTITASLPVEMTKELLRVLKPGGVIFITAFIDTEFNAVLRSEGEFLMSESLGSVIFRKAKGKLVSDDVKSTDGTRGPTGGIDLGGGSMEMSVSASRGLVPFGWTSERWQIYQHTSGFSPVISNIRLLPLTTSIPEVDQLLANPRG